MEGKLDRYRECPPVLAEFLLEIVRQIDIGIKLDRRGRGRPPADLRKVLNALWFRLRTGCQWRALPPELAPGSTAYDWYRRLLQSGALQLLFAAAVFLYVENGEEELKQLGIDCGLMPAPLGGKQMGPNPTDRGKPGLKVSVLVACRGTPMSVSISAANVPDAKLLEQTLERMFPVLAEALEKLSEESGKKPELVGDKAYDGEPSRAVSVKHGLQPQFARRGTPDGGLPRACKLVRAFTERTIAWLKSFRAIRTCWARSPFNYLGELLLALSYLVLRRLGLVRYEAPG